MKTYNKFLETPFSEEANSLTPPEPPQEEDPQIKSKEKRQKQIKKMVLLKKLQAVRAGAGADIVAGYEPEGEQLDETPKGDVGKDPETVQRRRNEDQNRRRGDRGSRLPDKAQELRRREHKMRRGAKTGPLRSGKQPDKVSQDVSRLRRITDTFSSQSHRKEEFELDERLGGKGYKPYTSLTGKKVSGDWEDSDRGKGNKAKRRGGEDVEKKSPTYLAHVLNKKKKKVSEAKVDDVKYSKDEKRKNYETDVHTLSSNKGVRADRNKRRSATDVVFHGHSKVDRDRKQAHYKSRGVKKVKGVKEDAAFDFVRKKLEKEHGKENIITKDNPRKPQSAADKAKARAHQAKVDAENAAERKKDPSQGRYPKG